MNVCGADRPAGVIGTRGQWPWLPARYGHKRLRRDQPDAVTPAHRLMGNPDSMSDPTIPTAPATCDTRRRQNGTSMTAHFSGAARIQITQDLPFTTNGPCDATGVMAAAGRHSNRVIRSPGTAPYV